MSINLKPDADTQRLIRRNRLVMALGVAALLAAVFFLMRDTRTAAHTIRLSAGSEKGRRHELALLLARLANPRTLRLAVTPTAGSAEALLAVSRGELDAALVQGGLEPQPGVREVAALYPEPLHLLSRREYVPLGVAGLKGRRVSLSVAGSGTRALALEVLAFTGLEPGRDFTEQDLAYEDIEKTAPGELPDAFFMVSSLPSPVAAFLVRERGYGLVPLPVGEALRIRDFRIEPTVIPAYTYGYVPPSPPEEVPTVANRLLLVANEGVPEEAVKELLGLIYEGDFARAASLPVLDVPNEQRLSEYPLHPGTLAYLNRGAPIVTSALIDNLESLRSFFVSIAIALFLLWRWYDRRQGLGFETYIDEVTRLEQSALALERRAEMDLAELMSVRQRLSEIKNEALEKFARGELKGEELMSSFLTHVTDVRNYINALILHARERIEKAAARGEIPKERAAQLAVMWERAMGDFEEK